MRDDFHSLTNTAKKRKRMRENNPSWSTYSVL